MDDKDLKIQNLTRDLARWKNRALEAAQRACDECEEYIERKGCPNCRINKIKEEAVKE